MNIENQKYFDSHEYRKPEDYVVKAYVGPQLNTIEKATGVLKIRTLKFWMSDAGMELLVFTLSNILILMFSLTIILISY